MVYTRANVLSQPTKIPHDPVSGSSEYISRVPLFFHSAVPRSVACLFRLRCRPPSLHSMQHADGDATKLKKLTAYILL